MKLKLKFAQLWDVMSRYRVKMSAKISAWRLKIVRKFSDWWTERKKKKEQERKEKEKQKKKNLAPVFIFISSGATAIAFLCSLVSGRWYFFLCFLVFVFLIVVIFLYFAWKKQNPNGDKEKEGVGPRPKRRWPRWVAWVFVLAFIALAIVKFFPFIEKSFNQLRDRTSTTYNYNPERVCEDARELDYSDFTGDHFVVTPREGCWGGYVTLPTAWKWWFNFKGVGVNSDRWVAFSRREYPPEGPFGRNAEVELTFRTVPFRLQGNQPIEFSRRY